MKFVRYIAVQLVAYGLDMGSFLLLYEAFGSGPVLANAVAKVVAGLFAFSAHRSFTFNATAGANTGKQAGLYFALLALNVPLSSTALALTLLFISQPVLAKIFADAICVSITYTLSKRYVFVAAGDAPAQTTVRQRDPL